MNTKESNRHGNGVVLLEFCLGDVSRYRGEKAIQLFLFKIFILLL